MRIKVGTTWSRLCPERFEQNKNERPIPMIELWFDDAEKLRIQRDGFIMPKLQETIDLKKQLDATIARLDPCNAIRKAVCSHDYTHYRDIDEVFEEYCSQCGKKI